MSEDKAKRIFNKMMEKDRFSHWMGISPVLLEEGHCVIQMTVKEKMLNGFEILHGGVAYAFADSAFAFASNSFGRIAVSIQGSMNFEKSSVLGETLFAEAKAIRVNHKTANFDVEIYNQNKEVYYRFRGTVYRKSDSVLEN